MNWTVQIYLCTILPIKTSLVVLIKIPLSHYHAAKNNILFENDRYPDPVIVLTEEFRQCRHMC